MFAGLIEGPGPSSTSVSSLLTGTTLLGGPIVHGEGWLLSVLCQGLHFSADKDLVMSRVLESAPP